MNKTCFTSLAAALFCIISLHLQAQPLPLPEVTISATVANTAEGSTAPGVFTITRGPGTNLFERPYTSPMRVLYRIGGTAQNGFDYMGITNNVYIPAYSNAISISITPMNDTLVEGDETVSLTLLLSPFNSNTPYSIGLQSNAVVTIADNTNPRNLPPTVAVADPTDGARFFAPATINIFAQASDADGLVQQVEFFAGGISLGVATNNPYSMSPVNPWRVTWSNVLEGIYTLTAVATDDDGAVATSAPVKITVSTPPVQPVVEIVATTPDASEDGPTPGVFTVTRKLPPNVLSFWYVYPTRVFYRIGGTASNGVDYQSINSFVVIPTNADSATITINPIRDRLVEGPESVELQLWCPVMDSQPPYEVGPGSNAVVTIADSDPQVTNPPPFVRIYSPTNGSTFTAPANITIVPEQLDPNHVLRSVEFFEGTNRLGVTTNDPNVVYFRDPLIFFWNNVPPGYYRLTVVATDDQGATSLSEPVHITVQPGPVQQPVVSVVATDPYGSEIPVVPPGMGMPQRCDPAVFTVSRTGDTDFPMTVFYNLGGTAENGVDYDRLTTSITIPTGASSADIVVSPTDDSLFERTESVVLTLEPIACIAIYPPPKECYLVGRPNQATAYILDNDTNQPPVQPPVVSIVATDPDAAEIPVVPPWLDMVQRYDPGVFTVTRTGSTENPLTVFYYATGNAQNGIDYERLSNYVVIPAGAASADIIVSPIDDALVEGPERVILQLRPAMLMYADNSAISERPPTVWPPPYLVGSPSNAVVIIADDDISTDTNIPPQVQLVRPMNNACFRAPANILLVATATDFDGSVSSVEFFEGAKSLGFGAPTAVLSSVYPAGQFALMWSNVPAGKYTLTAKATDNQDAATISAPVMIAVLVTNLPPVTNTLPVVSITAIDSIASEGRFDFPTTVILQSNLLCSTAVGLGPTSTWVRLDPSLSNSAYWTNIWCGTNTATFEVRRSGPTNDSLTVIYSIQGTASNGVDYMALPRSVTIPAGRRAAQIVIVPIDDRLLEYNETVTLTLALPPTANSSIPLYRIGSPSHAGAIILDNEYVLPPITPLRDGAFHVFLPAINGSGYRLETSSNFSSWDPCLTTTVDGAGLHYIDPDASGTVRFYRLVPEPVIVPEE